MLTTSLDGIWVLQVLSGIEVLAPELGLRPHLPRAETTQMALGHPVAEELRAAGVIDADGGVDQTVVEWLTVLSRREVGLLLYAQTPIAVTEPVRVLLARFAQWWVSLERYRDLSRISGVGTATTEQAAGMLIQAQIDRLCGEMVPTAAKPVTIDVGELLASVRDRAGLRDFLAGRNYDSDQVALLMLAADSERSARASLVAIQSGIAHAPARSHIAPDAVTIIDTPQGRVLCEQVHRAGRRWLIVSPGSAASIRSAVQTMMRRLPAQDDWYSHRKAV
jgi:hypothetical protein